METLLLSRSECAALLEPATLVAELREAFVRYSTDRKARAHRVRARIGDGGTSTVLFPGRTRGRPGFTVKIHAKFPGQDPAIRGVLCLHDLESGALLAVMDSTFLTAVRTGLSGALAADVLARPDASTVAVVGAGVQGTHQLRSLAGMRSLRQVWVYDTDPRKSAQFAADRSDELDLRVERVSTLERATVDADIVLAATWSETPFLTPDRIRPGAHVTTLGADEPGKAEVSAALLQSALFICDDRHLAVEMGALAGAGLGPDSIGAELGEVLGGLHPGRRSADEITVFGGVGLAFQDAVTAWSIYERARRTDVGRRFDFLG